MLICQVVIEGKHDEAIARIQTYKQSKQRGKEGIIL